MASHSGKGFLNRLHLPYIKEKPKPKEWTVMEKQVCVECKEEVARYWGNKLCESCFREILTEGKDERKEKVYKTYKKVTEQYNEALKRLGEE